MAIVCAPKSMSQKLMLLGVVTATLIWNGCSNDGSSADGAGGSASSRGGSAGVGAVTPCFEKPSELPRPPKAGLPCDLIPPTVTNR